MKQVKLLLVLVIMLSGAYLAKAQCEDEVFLDVCEESLGDYSFLEAFKIYSKDFEDKENKKEFSHLMVAGKSYYITVCNPDYRKNLLILNLYDRNRKIISSTFNIKTKQHENGISYSCTATGLYFLEFEFEKSTPYCGVGIIGVKKY